MELDSSLPCPDWVWSNNSNVHVAKDRKWFTEYTPFRSVVRDLSGHKLQVAGVGTVNLPVKRHPKRTGRDAHTIIKLQNVLHVPTSLCNILGNSLPGYTVSSSSHLPKSANKGCIISKQGRVCAFFDRDHPMFSVKLSGPPRGPIVGPSVILKNRLYAIHALWDTSELQRWKQHQESRERKAPDGAGNSVGERNWSDPYTAEEIAWLKKSWGNEFQFLRAHGLNIHKEEDRSEGRVIVRALMWLDEDGDDEGEASWDEDET